MNPYFQVFCGERSLQTQPPCHSTELVKFRNRIGEKGIELIFHQSIQLHGDAVCNLAAQAGVRYSLTNPRTYVESNMVGFVNILEACQNYSVPNLCYASSSSVYGLNEELPTRYITLATTIR